MQNINLLAWLTRTALPIRHLTLLIALTVYNVSVCGIFWIKAVPFMLSISLHVGHWSRDNYGLHRPFFYTCSTISHNLSRTKFNFKIFYFAVTSNRNSLLLICLSQMFYFESHRKIYGESKQLSVWTIKTIRMQRNAHDCNLQKETQANPMGFLMVRREYHREARKYSFSFTLCDTAHVRDWSPHITMVKFSLYNKYLHWKQRPWLRWILYLVRESIAHSPLSLLIEVMYIRSASNFLWPFRQHLKSIG